MNAFLSKKIKFINLVLCSMIVFLHATYKYLPGEYATGELVNFQFEIMRYLTVVMAAAVPTFFVMSAYLFFITYQGLKDYVPKIKKRVVSVAIPYFIFGVGTYIYYYILVNYTNLFDSKTIPEDIIGVIKYILLCEGNPPLWYLRTLFCFLWMTLSNLL